MRCLPKVIAQGDGLPFLSLDSHPRVSDFSAAAYFFDVALNTFSVARLQM